MSSSERINRFPIYSLRDISLAATAEHRQRLVSARKRVQAKLAGKVGDQIEIEHNSLWVSDENGHEFPGENKIPYNMVVLGNSSLRSAQEHEIEILILHESIHILLAENLLFAVRREFPQLWEDTRSALERSLSDFNSPLPQQRQITSSEIKQLPDWLGADISSFVIRTLGTPEKISDYMREDVRKAYSFMRKYNLSADIYFKFLAMERLRKVFLDVNALAGLERVYFEEAFVNVLVPWILEMDFYDVLYAFKIDPDKVQLSINLHDACAGREEELLQAFTKKGMGLFAFFSELKASI